MERAFVVRPPEERPPEERPPPDRFGAGPAARLAASSSTACSRVTVSAVLGKSGMEVSQLLKLGKGTIVELDRKVGEAIDIYVNDRLVARGEVVLVEDRLGITMTEIIKSGSGS